MEKQTYELKKLSTDDGKDIYEMSQKLAADENGLENKFYGMDYSEYKEQLVQYDKESQGIDLKEGYVPHTIYWFYVNGEPVGLIKIRHELTDHLREHGGHIGYAIIPDARGKGYGTKMLELAIEEAKTLGIKKILITCKPDNYPSQKVAEKNGGILERKTEKSFYYWIGTNKS